MTKGLPKWAIKKAQAAKAKNVFAYAWSLVKKTSGKKPKTLNPKKRKSNPVRRMARRYARRRRRSSGMTIPIAPILGLVAGAAEPIAWGMGEGFKLDGGWLNDQNGLIARYTGYSPWFKDFKLDRMKNGILPLVLGVLIHKFVGGKPLNVNAMLARSKIPFVRI